MGLTRQKVWSMLGAPTDQVGSVNDPRFSEDYGTKWNEKWVYCRPHSTVVDRLVLWNRYDFAGAFRILPDGTAEPEKLPED